MSAAVILALFIYPVKSCGALSLQRVFLDWNGFKWDRRWMVVDERGKFVTQRAVPKMALIRPRVEMISNNLTLVLVAPGMPVCVAPVPDRFKRREVRVWNDQRDAIDMGDEPARWLSTFLGRRVRLVHADLMAHRVTNTSTSGSVASKRLAFADAYPFTIAILRSLQAVSEGVGYPIPVSRFRPNVLIGGMQRPFDEDRWSELTVAGRLSLEVEGPIPRCNVVNTCQDTGMRAGQPLDWLTDNRTQPYTRNGSQKKGPMFGVNVNAKHLCQGDMRVGDQIDIRYRDD